VPNFGPLEKMLKRLNYKKIFILSLVIFTLGLSFKFILCSRMAVENNNLKELFLRKSALEKEVSRLGFEDSNLSSLAYVENRAKSLGFVEMKERLISVDINSPIQVASLTR